MSKTLPVIHDITLISDYDIFLFRQGSHFRLYEKLGSNLMTVNGEPGVFFAAWAPDAEYVSVVGNFNGWNRKSNPLKPRGDQSGIWEGFIPGLGSGELYKYHIRSRYRRYRADKGDPFAFHWEVMPKTASTTWELHYDWQDTSWMETRRERNSLDTPLSIYEVHLGSWKRGPEDNHRLLSYREIAEPLADYVTEMGFTHVEFLPLMEHPFYGSWGYQTTGYFAPSSRYGTPQDLMFLIDHLHQRGIGIILDWVPSHFPTDEFGLGYFDGTHLFEHADARKGFHPDWKSFIFNYGRPEVQSFLISSAFYWLDRYHADVLRIDAVASMLYLDYSRKAGEWIPNKHGGRENLEAIAFLKRLNEAVYAEFPDTQTVAEESTAWPMVTKPTYIGGLGFGMKWNMGWMHDTLVYMSKNPVFRKFHHNQLTFSILYAFSENFLLPLSHDEVVHGKGSLIGKMPGDDWQKFANLRLLFGYMYGHPGKKLLFMGGEFGQWREWNHDESLDWHLLDHEPHQGIRKLVSDLNRIYREEPSLHEIDFKPEGFEWLDAGDWEASVMSFFRKGTTPGETILVVCNFTPVPRHDYRFGVPENGFWAEIINTDSPEYGGSGVTSGGGLYAAAVPWHGRPYSVSVTLPPLAVIFLKHTKEAARGPDPGVESDA